MPELRALSNYRNSPRNIAYEAGTVFEATEEHWLFLQADAPGCFEPVTKAPAAPPANKAILDAPERKAQGDDLTVIPGISAARARRLAKMGITTFEALAAAPVGHLKTIHGVGEATASEWIEGARGRL